MKALRNLGRNPRLTVGYLLVSGLLAGGLAACSGSGSEAVAPTVELTSSAPTTIATTTTSTTEPTTTTIDPNIAEIEAVYRAYFEVFLPEGGMSAGEGLEEFATDSHIAVVMTNVNRWLAEGSTIGDNDYDVHVLTIEIDGDRAVLRSCNLDAISLVDSSGVVVTEADSDRYYRVGILSREGGAWKLAEHGLEGGVRTICAIG